MTRRILITGVSRGLGHALVPHFIEAGHTVAGIARSAAGLWDLQQRFGSPHRFDVVDVTDDAAVRRWISSCVMEIGPPDLVINNAALINTNAPLWKVPRDEFHALLDVNLGGVFSVIRHVVPHMIESGSGVIVNLSSGWGRSVSPDVAPYCTTKWGIEGMTRALAAELPEGVAAVPLNPGVIDTDMLRSTFGDGSSAYPSADDWARRAAPFLLGLGPEHNGRPETVPG